MATNPAGSAASLQPHGPGLSGRQAIIILLVLTFIGAGGGVGLGMYLSGSPPSQAVPAGKGLAAESAKPHDNESAKHGEELHAESPPASAAADLQIKELPPIVTNLAAPVTSLVRLQASVVYDAKALPHPEIFVAEFTGDALGFLKTLSMSWLEGAEGLRRLGEELNDRAAIRSHGNVRELVIQSMVVQ